MRRTVAVVVTVLNEEKAMPDLLGRLLAQDRRADLIVIVDGGSTDNTASVVDTYTGDPSIRFLLDPTCNIRYTPSPVAKGRNLGIRYAKGAGCEIVAVTDAGSIPEPAWLNELVRPIEEEGMFVVGGMYLPGGTTLFQRASIPVLFDDVAEKIRDIRNVSSRSIAFIVPVWEKVGGYPEVALTAEDTLFNVLLAEFVPTKRYAAAPRAIVRWAPPKTFQGFMRQQYRYAKGDALCQLRSRWYGKIGALVGAGVGMSLIWPLYTPAAVGLYALSLTRNKGYRTRLFPLSAAIRISADLARFAGYCVGNVDPDALTKAVRK